MDSKITPINPKGNQPWIFSGRTDAEGKFPTLWPPDAKSQLIGKDTDAGKFEGKRRMGWQRMSWLDGITDSTDMNLSKRDGEGQGSLVCCSSWGHKDSDITEQLNINVMTSTVSFILVFLSMQIHPSYMVSILSKNLKSISLCAQFRL